MEDVRRIFDGKNNPSDRSKAFWLWLRWGEEGYPPETWNHANWRLIAQHAPPDVTLPPKPKQ